MSRGLNKWWTSSSDEGLEMVGFRRACKEINRRKLSQGCANKEKYIMAWLNTHQEAEAIFEFLEYVDEFLLWWGACLYRELIICWPRVETHTQYKRVITRGGSRGGTRGALAPAEIWLDPDVLFYDALWRNSMCWKNVYWTIFNDVKQTGMISICILLSQR